MEHKHREGESGTVPARTDRYFCLANEWYFTTRENQIHGPFETREEASEALAVYISIVTEAARHLDGNVLELPKRNTR